MAQMVLHPQLIYQRPPASAEGTALETLRNGTRATLQPYSLNMQGARCPAPSHGQGTRNYTISLLYLHICSCELHSFGAQYWSLTVQYLSQFFINFIPLRKYRKSSVWIHHRTEFKEYCTRNVFLIEEEQLTMISIQIFYLLCNILNFDDK